MRNTPKRSSVRNGAFILDDGDANPEVEDDIAGEALIELLHEELIDLGIESVGHRMTILRSVYDVKMQQNVPVMHDHYVPPCRSEITSETNTS